MQTDLQITVRDMPHSEALDARIRERIAKLEKICPRLTSCHVVIAAPHYHQQYRKLFAVRLNIMFPGGEVVVKRDNHEDIYIVLHDAFDAAWRELAKATGRRNGSAEPHHGLRQREPPDITMEAANE